MAFYANMYSSILCSLHQAWTASWRASCTRWRRPVAPPRCALAACAATWLLLLAALSRWRAPASPTPWTLGIVPASRAPQSNMLPSVAMWAAFLFTLFVLLFLVPFVITVACYTATILTLLRSADARTGRAQRPPRRLAGRRGAWLSPASAPSNSAAGAHMVSRLFLGRSYYHIYKLTLLLQLPQQLPGPLRLLLRRPAGFQCASATTWA